MLLKKLLLVISLVLLASFVLAQESSKEEEALFVAKKSFEDGFYEVSLDLLGRFLKNYPTSVKRQEVELLIGQCYFYQDRFLDALAKFEELLKNLMQKDIKDAVLYWIAEVHFKGNAFAKAAQYYKMVIDEFPTSSYIAASVYSLGWCLFQEHEFEQALRYFKTIEDKFPQTAYLQDSSFKILECLYNSKNYITLKDGVKSYLKAYSKDSVRLAYLYFYLAEANYYLNDFSEAIEWYLKVISSTSDNRIQALSKLGMGWSYLKLKKYKDAQKIFSEIESGSLQKSGNDVLWLGKAIWNFETNRFNEAKNIYEELLNSTTDPAILIQAYLGKGDSLYNMLQYKEAIGVYKEGLSKIGPESAPREIIDKLHYGLAFSFLKEGEFKQAIDEFQKIVQHTEDKVIKVSALCQIGDAYQDSGDYHQATQTYDTILKDYPDSFYSDYVQYQLGLTLLKLRNFQGAIMALQRLKKDFPNSKLLDDAAYALGLAYFQKEDYASSKDIFERFRFEFKDSNLKFQAIYLQGSSLYNLGRFSEAVEVFKDILRLNPQDTELIQKAEYEIADCYYQMDNEKEAMLRFKMLRAKYPDSRLTAEVIWWLGQYYYRANDLNLARRYLISLIQDFPKSSLIPSAYYALASTFEEEAKYSEAIENFKKVMELDKSDLKGTAAIAVADIYVRQDRLNLALAMYKEAVENHNNLAHLIYPKIGDIYYNLREYEQALDFYRKSLDVVTVREMSSIQFKIADTLQMLAELPEAVQEYLKVTYLYSENDELVIKSLLRVAAIYENADNLKEALNIYKRVCLLNSEEAKYAKEKIELIKTQIK